MNGEPKRLSRRQALAALGMATGGLVAEQALLGDTNRAASAARTVPSTPSAALAPSGASVPSGPQPGGYAPDGAAGRAAALPLSAVTLLDSPFRQNQQRNTAYLLFLDPERLLRSFRVNYGQPVTAQPCGGWELPASQIRGHTAGHLMSALALTYASTGDGTALARGRYLVSQLAALQARAGAAGFHPGYLSAFPEAYFDLMEQGKPIWSPYYMIHKYLAGLIDQYQLAGDAQALDVAVKLGDWVQWRTGRLSYQQMQAVLNYEFGGLPEALANLYTITGAERYLATAQRFYHAQVLDPLADGVDALAGLQANVTTPKIIACLRMWEETGSARYRDIAQNFWDIVTGHHIYAIGGAGNYEHFQAPDAIADQLSNFTCENCVSYNLLKLTRLLHFHQLTRIDLLDYYERTLFNQMLGEQDPTSPHGFNCYYTGLSPGAFKRQPLNYFPTGDPGVYATDYDTFTCDTATGLETQAKFADTIYSQDADGIYVNLFIPSEVTSHGLVLRQSTAFPDTPATRLSVVSGAAIMTLRVRIPSWTSDRPLIALNGIPQAQLPANGWLSLRRNWQTGDTLDVTLPMTITPEPTPDHPTIQAFSYGPLVLAATSPTNPGPLTPRLAPAAIHQTPTPATPVPTTTSAPLTFTAEVNNHPTPLIPVSRATHTYYTVYFQTV